MEVALKLGDAPEALYRQGFAEDEVPDALSACTGCAALDAIRLEKAMGRYAHAAAIAVGVLGVLRPGCRSQPHSLQALALLPLSLTGHHELAIECAESAWPGLLDNAFAHGYAGHLLLWCAWSGQTRQAVELLEEYLPILEDNPRPVGGRMRFLTGAAVVARRAAEDLGPDAAIGGARAGFLARRWSDEARGLAARFDERNGSEAVGRRTDAALTVPAWDGSTIEALPAPALGRAAREADAAPSSALRPAAPPPGLTSAAARRSRGYDRCARPPSPTSEDRCPTSETMPTPPRTRPSCPGPRNRRTAGAPRPARTMRCCSLPSAAPRGPTTSCRSCAT
ncbi:hypothetical protein [Brachybacterium nesterenkovii]|uniref:hypothetical protein n=1 Tax=Brachybacterium nesterenkovii TaxID=47847 RepID=UPI001F2DD626|nr:hypothetical protein [Brachybacterium nesterenkovii]